METKGKLISGLKYGSDFSQEERFKIVQEYFSSGKKKRDIWFKYTGHQDEHGQILRWIRELGFGYRISG